MSGHQQVLERALGAAVEVVLSIGLAVLAPVVFGIGAAIFISELCPKKLQSNLTTLIECVAVVPGIAYAYGSAALPASLREVTFAGCNAATFMVVSGIAAPTIALLTLHVLQSVPARLRDAAVALGATKVDVLVSVVLPITRSAVGGACVFGLVRAIGEIWALQWVSRASSPMRALGIVLCKGDPDCLSYHSAMRLAVLAITGLLSIAAYRLVRRRDALEEA